MIVVSGQVEEPVRDIKPELTEQIRLVFRGLSGRGFHAHHDLAMLKGDHVRGARDPHELLMDRGNFPIRDQHDQDFFRDLISCDVCDERPELLGKSKKLSSRYLELPLAVQHVDLHLSCELCSNARIRGRSYGAGPIMVSLSYKTVNPTEPLPSELTLP
jgi:hypothetical protein